VFFLKDKIGQDDYIIIHDAVRPILPQKAIEEVLRVAHAKGNASSSIVTMLLGSEIEERLGWSFIYTS